MKCDTEGIRVAGETIKRGGIVVFPTDTVYGIGCDPYNKDAVASIYRIKSRDTEKQFPILGASKADLSKIAIFDKRSSKIAEKFWPGSITLILKLKDEKLKESLGLENKVAVRVPNNQCALSLLKQCNLLVGTSANISGSSPHTNPEECAKRLAGYDLLLDGGTITNTIESTIVEIKENEIKVLRKGDITKEEILNIF